MLDPYYHKRDAARSYEVFRSQGFAADWVINTLEHGPIAMGSLPPFLRALLVTDGTVTKTLAAYYWEPIVVDTIFQAPVDVEDEVDWLELKVGDRVLGRKVNLRGATSDRLYARALSVIRVELLPDALSLKIRAGALGLGELLRDCGLETYRELLEIGATTAASESDQFAPREAHIFRTYRILLSGRPVILVTEHFPERLYRDGSLGADLLMRSMLHEADQGSPV